jgi:hypothetical protein
VKPERLTERTGGRTGWLKGHSDRERADDQGARACPRLHFLFSGKQEGREAHTAHGDHRVRLCLIDCNCESHRGGRVWCQLSWQRPFPKWRHFLASWPFCLVGGGLFDVSWRLHLHSAALVSPWAHPLTHPSSSARDFSGVAALVRLLRQLITDARNNSLQPAVLMQTQNRNNSL